MAKSNKQIEQEVLSLLDSQGISSKDVFELEELPCESNKLKNS